MLAKLGHLLYWVGSGLAVVALVSGVFILQHGLDQDYRWIVYVAFHRECRRLLAGRMDVQILSGWRMNLWRQRR